MKQPIYYLQKDAKWKNYNYSAKGEKKTIGSSGCGVACTAMVIASIKDSKITPIDTAEWSMKHGYKALNQGTYYSYFAPQLKAYGIQCTQLNKSNLYGKTTSDAHTKALTELQKGNWIIACMGKGNWTSSGHFILVYGYENGYVYVNDPASKSSNRVKNTWNLFSKQVKYMWSVTVPETTKSNSATTINNTSNKSSSVDYVYKGVNYSPLFNPTYYANKYTDLKKAFGTNATLLFKHFCEYGMKEGRQPSANFNVIAYKNRYVDLQRAFGDNLPNYYKHYCQYGYKEGRNAL